MYAKSIRFQKNTGCEDDRERKMTYYRGANKKVLASKTTPIEIWMIIPESEEFEYEITVSSTDSVIAPNWACTSTRSPYPID